MTYTTSSYKYLLQSFFENEGKKDYASDANLELTKDQWDELGMALENACLAFDNGETEESIEEVMCSYYGAQRDDMRL